MPWAEILQDFARYLHWSASEVLDGQTWAEFYTLWCGGGTQRRQHDPEALRAQLARKRAQKKAKG